MTPLDVVVIVPMRAGIPDRDRLWTFCRKWWEHDHPDWRIVEGVHEFGPFNRSAAINRGAREADAWDVAVIIDADVLADPHATASAVELAHATNRMVLGYNERIHLTNNGTEKVLGGFKGSWEQPGMIAKRFTDSCSSLVVVSRELFDRVGGFDEQFVGWGWEDVAFRIACETLGDGPMTKISSKLWHLHHRVSHENNPREHTYQANRRRADLYKAAHFRPETMRALLDDDVDPLAVAPEALEPSRIPRILHRTIPERGAGAEGDAFWEHWRQLHPGWQLMTHQDPLDQADWPMLGDLFERCQNGAQLAGLIRLEALWRWGGVYVDSDVEPYRSLEPLIHCQGFAGWEDKGVVPDAVLGAEPGHPAVELMIHKARVSIEAGEDAWLSGPGVTTATLPYRRDWLLLPPGSFYPYHYTDRAGRSRDHSLEQPWAFGAHHWAGSWLSDEQRHAIDRKAKTRRANG